MESDSHRLNLDTALQEEQECCALRLYERLRQNVCTNFRKYTVKCICKAI